MLAQRILDSATSTPFTVEITADWGMGKTPLMHRPRNELTNASQGDDAVQVTALEFNPWTAAASVVSNRDLGAQTLIAAIPASQHARSCSGVPPLTPTAPSTFPSPSLITIEPAPAISGSRVIWLTAATNAPRS
jgi:KAP family P-loop domain